MLKIIKSMNLFLCNYEKFYMDTKVHKRLANFLKVPFNRD